MVVTILLFVIFVVVIYVVFVEVLRSFLVLSLSDDALLYRFIMPLVFTFSIGFRLVLIPIHFRFFTCFVVFLTLFCPCISLPLNLTFFLTMSSWRDLYVSYFVLLYLCNVFSIFFLSSLYFFFKMFVCVVFNVNFFQC